MTAKWLIVSLVFILGISLRIYFYSFNRYFWIDEAALALNIANVGNYFLPLQWEQAAPAFFMYLSKLMYMTFSQKELALRFFPLIFSICSIFVFYEFTNKYCTKFITKFTSLLIFTFSYPLVYYAQEFKQYSLDVLVFLLILLSYNHLKTLHSPKEKIILSLLYSTAIFSSFPASFAIFTVFLILFIFNFHQFKKCTLMLVPILLSSLLFIFLNHTLISNENLHSYWHYGFLSFNIASNISLIGNLFKYIFSYKLMFLFFLISIYLCIKNKLYEEKYCLLYIPIILAVLLSFLKIYPLQNRVSLYLAPLIIILAVKFIDFIQIKNKCLEKTFSIFSVIILLLPLLSYTNSMICKKRVCLEDIVTPLNLALNKATKNDTIIISQGSKWSYEYYKDYFTTNSKIIVETEVLDEKHYVKQLETYKKGQYYLVFSHNKNKAQRLKTICEWAKTKENYYITLDKSLNALVEFTL